MSDFCKDFYWVYKSVSIENSSAESIYRASKLVDAPADAETMVNDDRFRFGLDDTVTFRWQEKI